MSVSFVASAVLTATADGTGFEETKIESKQVDAINQRNAHKPLFEQLRQNQEEAQAKEEEMKKEILRASTSALDEEDVAHLETLEKLKSEREKDLQRRTQDELAMFRAARLERQQQQHQQQEDDKDDENDDTEYDANHDMTFTTSVSSDQFKSGPSRDFPQPNTSSRTTSTGPRIVVKKRKRRIEESQKTMEKRPLPHNKTKPTNEAINEPKASIEAKHPEHQPSSATTSGGGGLIGLLSGYGSSDDDDNSDQAS